MISIFSTAMILVIGIAIGRAWSDHSHQGHGEAWCRDHDYITKYGLCPDCVLFRAVDAENELSVLRKKKL